MIDQGPLTADKALATAQEVSKDWADAWIDGILVMITAASKSGLTQVATSRPPASVLVAVRNKIKELGYVTHTTSDQWLVVSFEHKHSPSKVS